jgi:WD40 repeat protein
MKFTCILLIVFVLYSIRSLSQPTEPILTLNTYGHTGSIKRIGTDSTGKYLVTSSFDKTARLWDLSSGKLLKTFRVPINSDNVGMLTACAISPDAKYIATGGYTGFFNQDKKGTVIIFDVQTGEIVKTITVKAGAISELKFSLNGSQLIVGLSSGNGLEIYSTQDWKLLESDTDYMGIDLTIAYSNAIDIDKYSNLMYCNNSGQIRSYNDKLKTLEKKKFEKYQFSTIATSPDSSKIALASNHPAKILVLDSKTFELLYEPNMANITSISNTFFALDFSKDGKFLIAGGAYRKTINDKEIYQIRIWQNAGKGTYKDFNAGSSIISYIKSTSNGSYVYVSDFGDIVKASTSGQVQFKIPSSINVYSGVEQNQLTTSEDGSKIGIITNDTITFDINARRLKKDTIQFLPYSETGRGVKVENWKFTYQPTINSKKIKSLVTWDLSRCVDVSDDGKYVALGANQNLYCLNGEGKLNWKVTVNGISNIKISQDQKFIIASKMNGIINWYDMVTGKLLFSLYLNPDNKRWILWNPQGYFDCSPGAEDLIGWHLNQGENNIPLYYPVSQFYEKYYTPNLGSMILTGKNIASFKDEIRNMKLPPLVKITSPENNYTSSSVQITVEVDVTDQGGGIDEILLYHNGKLVETTTRGFKNIEEKTKASSKTFTIQLSPGENLIKATAFNNERTESLPYNISVNYQGQKAVSNLYVFAIGINTYKNNKYNLNFALPDAESFVDKLKVGSNQIFSKTKVVFIKNEEATKSFIISKLNDLKPKITQEDVFVFYYAGHGVMSEEEKSQFYLIPSDITQLYGNNSILQTNAISAAELQKIAQEIKAQKQLFIMDACQTGGMIDYLAKRGAAEEKAIAQLARSTGTVWIAASGSQQFAQEFADLKHGLFTYCILQALNGLADGSPKDQKITVGELSNYLNSEVPELSQKFRGTAQYPNVYSFGQDFPLIMVK